ncbi:MAG TPA: hypothetical protein V6D22_14660 [Candidatus Obscuribacterales bacterium]
MARLHNGKISIFIFFLLCGVIGCSATAKEGMPAAGVSGDQPHLPPRVLWAWQRSEDLSYINPRDFGVAYLACHAVLTEDSVLEHWRDQPLHVPPDTVLSPVLRIDTSRNHAANLSEEQLWKLAKIVGRISALPRTAQVQIDFDAVETERPFYRRLLELVKKENPQIRLSITALASWCIFDNWIKDLPVAETVPMLFSLGTERAKVLLYFRTCGDFLVTGCCKSLGLSLEDEEVNKLMIPKAKERTIAVRFYVFTKTAWNRKKYQTVRSMLSDQ